MTSDVRGVHPSHLTTLAFPAVAHTAWHFAAAWSQTGIPRERWYAGVATYCTREFARRMSLIYPNSQVGRSQVPGLPHGTAVSYSSATTRVSMTGHTMIVRLLRIGETWLVDDYQLDRSQAATTLLEVVGQQTPPRTERKPARVGTSSAGKLIVGFVALVLLCAGGVAAIAKFSKTSDVASLLTRSAGCVDGETLDAGDSPSSGTRMGRLDPAVCANDDPISGPRGVIVRIAKAEVGYDEEANNCNKYGVCGPWCAMFVRWVWREAGVTSLFETDWARAVPTESIESNGAKGVFKPHTPGTRDGSPSPGDAVVYGTPTQRGEGFGGHIGIVVKVHADGRIDTVEGNNKDRVRHLTNIDPARDTGGEGNHQIGGYVSPPGMPDA